MSPCMQQSTSLRLAFLGMGIICAIIFLEISHPMIQQQGKLLFHINTFKEIDNRFASFILKKKFFLVSEFQ